LKWIGTVLFAALRQHFSSEFQGQAIDPALAKQMCEWLFLSIGTMIRSCRPDDHLFVLMHLLRLPSKLLKSLSALIQPPDPTVVWNRSCTILEFLEQPEIQLHLTMFAACLRPVRNRTQFLLATNSDIKNVPESSSVPFTPQPDGDNPWVVVDSGGESDSEESLVTGCTNTTGTLSFSRTIRPESSIFIGPKDMDRLLRQLNLVRLIRLLDARGHVGIVLCTKESGLMTLMAFANRIMGLIESCAEIYSQHMDAPKSRDHLGSWRILAKRLASIVSTLVTAVGSRVRLAWSQYQQMQQQQPSVPSNYEEFARVLSQYDAFCLRASKCLLSGCGLPSTHQDAVRLVCWRILAQLFPFGFVSSRSKVTFLYLIIESLLPFWRPDSVELAQLPDHVIGPLHQTLLSIGLNDIGLGSILTTLGKLASVECRPVPIPVTKSGYIATYAYHLPELEATLVRAVISIIFGVSEVCLCPRMCRISLKRTQRPPPLEFR
uniref:MOR2-PAG1_C domain-containing protein n=1 Tax=Echinostoma caproni TaxID=27848 RepID=A0A183BDN8_9TREM